MTNETISQNSLHSFSEDEQHVGGNAHNFFKAAQYDSALGILKKLQKSHPNDPRLMHNRALTEFCKSSKTKVLEFRRSLLKVQKQLQQINNEEDYILSNEKNSYVVLCYNQALVMFDTHQYYETEALLEKLNENLDSPEESLLLRINLLRISTYLYTYKADKASDLISWIEKNFLNTNDTKLPSNDGKGSALFSTPSEVAAMRSYLNQLKTCCYLQQKALKACKKEMKFLSNLIDASTSSAQASIIQMISAFFRSNYEYVRGNYHKAHKILASCSPPSNQSSVNVYDNLAAMYYNNLALMHFNMAKYHIGSFYLQKAVLENDNAVQVAAKHHYAAISTVGSRHHQQIPTGKPLAILSMNKRFELLYNYGLMLLNAGNPSAAFDCFLGAVCGFRANPRLWFRLAECCIQKCTVCATDTNAKNKKPQQQNHNPFSVVGSGHHQKIVVNVASLHTMGGKLNNIVTPSPTLEFASVCLKNALVIMTMAMPAQNEKNKSQGNSSDHLDHVPRPKSRCSVACPPGAPVSGIHFDHLYASILVNSAFVALCLRNNLVAYEHTQTVLSLPTISPCHRYLASMYAAEALTALDRISDAIQFLSTEKITSVSSDVDEIGRKSPVSDDGSSKSNCSANSNSKTKVLPRRGATHTSWQFPPNLECARGCMLVNLANAHSMRSEYDKALGILQRAAPLLGAKQNLPQVVLLAVYVHLLNGGDGMSTVVKLLTYNSPVLNCLGKPENENATMQSVATGGNLPNSGGATGDSSASSTASNSSRSKPNTPQPSAGGITPERVVKSREGKKRNRR